MLKLLFNVLFFSITLTAAAQLQDDFSDGDCTGNPSWSGDVADFAVNAAGQLQLNAAVAGKSHLVLPLPASASGDLEWRFFIRQNFAPSSANYGRFYLFSDQLDLEGALQGYYLQFGEALSNDAVELFRQDGTSSMSVCRATNGQIASAFSLGIKVTRDVIGTWTLWIDANGGTSYQPAATGMEGMYTPGGYTGLLCTYTSGNRQNFYFDDIFCGSLQVDTIPPTLNTVHAVSSTALQLSFSEILDPATAGLTGNYLVDNGMGNPLSATRDETNPSRVQLDFSGPFPPGVPLTLSVSDVQDLGGNSVQAGTQAAFIFYPPVQANPQDVIFSEVMFEPSSSSILPDAEFVEVLNRSSQAIPLTGWTLSDGSATATFPEMVLLPSQFLILCSAPNASLFSPYGLVAGLNSFPGLNNDTGDQLVLRDAGNNIIDVFRFDNNSYHNAAKDDGGYSLERIDTSFVCADDRNWMASCHPSGGTPGQVNCANGVHHDFIAPAMLRARLSDSTHVLLILSEEPDTTTATNLNNYSFYKNGFFLGSPVSVQHAEESRLLLELPFIADQGTYTLVLSGALRDCPGNAADSLHRVRFAFPEQGGKGDVVINELLFHPQPGGVDFVEVYNRSQKVLDMKDWRIAEGDYEDPETLLSSQKISEETLLLFPGDYLVLTEDPEAVRSSYLLTEKYAFFDVPDLPDFNSTEGEVVLLFPDGSDADRFLYSEDMHFPLLTTTEGVSLERFSCELPTDAKENWHSSSSANGYATPGFLNSVVMPQAEAEERVEIDPDVFSPDNDGYLDLLTIRILEPGMQNSGSVLIFDSEGRQVRALAPRFLAGDETVLVWDGLNDSREAVPMGLYVIVGELFDTSGKRTRFRKACGVMY